MILEGDISKTPLVTHVIKVDGETSYAFWQNLPSFLKFEHCHIK